VLAFLRQQHDFVSLRQVREGLGFLDPRPGSGHPVNWALAALADRGAIRVVEPVWLDTPYFAAGGADFSFPESGYLPVVLRPEGTALGSALAWAAWPPGRADLVLRARIATWFDCVRCGREFEGSVQSSELVAVCAACGHACLSREIVAMPEYTGDNAEP
jgi:hypothetical protein